MIKKIARWIVRFASKFCFMPDKPITMEERAFYFGEDRTGDVIFSRVDWCLTNIGIWGHYKHLGIVDGKYVIEAVTGPGVIRTPIEEFLRTKDKIAVGRVRKANHEQRKQIAYYASLLLGKAYDFVFQ